MSAEDTSVPEPAFTWHAMSPIPVLPCPVDPSKPIQLVRCQNGGWLVEQGEFGGHRIPLQVGAYSSAADMVAALSAALLGGGAA